MHTPEELIFLLGRLLRRNMRRRINNYKISLFIYLTCHEYHIQTFLKNKHQQQKPPSLLDQQSSQLNLQQTFQQTQMRNQYLSYQQPLGMPLLGVANCLMLGLGDLNNFTFLTKPIFNWILIKTQQTKVTCRIFELQIQKNKKRYTRKNPP